jgi:YYY domain-containing protein
MLVPHHEFLGKERQGVRATILWWLALSAMGWLAWPLAHRLFRALPGRGYAFARALGLLLVVYCFWLGGMLGLWPNTTATLWGVVLALAVAGGVAGWHDRMALAGHLRREWPRMLAVELLFAAMLALYALWRASIPVINHTEQPMDYAFLNGMLRSPRMPPDDPWLAGHAISYYYLGYLMVAAMVRLTGVPAGVGYNLGLAQILALTVSVGYGLLDALLRMGHETDAGRRGIHWVAMIGALGLGWAGNLAGLLELPRALGLAGETLYRRLGLHALAGAAPTGNWLPGDTWWWWRASRVIVDENPLGRIPTVITEFPAFSLVLGDLHPHVMALPYTLLALAVAAALYRPCPGCEGVFDPPWRRIDGWLFPLLLGALGFLNSWDLPTFTAVALAVFWLGRRGEPLTTGLLWTVWLVTLALLPYVPFYAGLSSQVRGVGLAYYAWTPLSHYLLVFGPWLLPVLADLPAAAREVLRPHRARRRLLAIWGVVFLLPWGATLAMGGVGRLLLALATLAGTGPWLLLGQSVVMTVLLAGMWRVWRQEGHSDTVTILGRLLVLVAVSLTYVTEFVYLRDVFDTRMNTVFKFYYQAWVLYAMGAMLLVWRQWRAGRWRRAVTVAGMLLLAATLYYPLAAGRSRIDEYAGPPTLDGTAFLAQQQPAEYGAYRWLDAAARPGDVLAEAPGRDYVPWTSRLSAWTGVPTVLGWPGHQVQWRGDDVEVRRRLPDLEVIYTSHDCDEVLAALRGYGVTYLYVGPEERSRYGVDDRRLMWYETFLQPGYARGGVRLFVVPGD